MTQRDGLSALQVPYLCSQIFAQYPVLQWTEMHVKHCHGGARQASDPRTAIARLLAFYSMEYGTKCIHNYSIRLCASLYSLYMYIILYMYIHNSILLLFPFLRVYLLSLFPFLSLMLVCYKHILHVHACVNVCSPCLLSSVLVCYAHNFPCIYIVHTSHV